MRMGGLAAEILLGWYADNLVGRCGEFVSWVGNLGHVYAAVAEEVSRYGCQGMGTFHVCREGCLLWMDVPLW